MCHPAERKAVIFRKMAPKTMKYRTGFPVDGFATLAEAQTWVPSMPCLLPILS